MTDAPRYSIREVDGGDEEYASELRTLNTATFGDTAPQLVPEDLEAGHWWLCFQDKEAVAFAGLKHSARWSSAGYLCRVGVMPLHRGIGLQRRLLRARESKARRNGWEWTVTDTTDNVPSANSLISAGYKLYRPTWPWAYEHTLYWRKRLIKEQL